MTNQHLPKPPAWALTHNRDKWTDFNPVFDPLLVIDWSLANNYRVTEQMAPGDPVVFWMTGKEGGVARIGFLISLDLERLDTWEDSFGVEHKNNLSGRFFLPPFPQATYIARAAIEQTTAFKSSELGTPGVNSSTPPLRVEQELLDVILGLAEQLGETLLPAYVSRAFPEDFSDSED